MSYTHDNITVNGEVIINIYNNNDMEEKENDNRKISTIRGSKAVNTAKKNVKARDCACMCCNEVPKNNHLEVHHIMPLSKYKELASDERNMISLCQKCHKKYHSLYDDDEVGAVTFANFMRDFANRRY